MHSYRGMPGQPWLFAVWLAKVQKAARSTALCTSERAAWDTIERGQAKSGCEPRTQTYVAN